MIKKGIFLIGLTGLAFSSCIEHEVIPPPEPEVELICDFEGTVGGAFIEYTENVNGYACSPGLAKQTQSNITDAQYLFGMASNDYIQYIQIALGSITWNDPTGTETPGLSLFNNFFTSNLLPQYSNAALNGFEARYQDQYGDVWTSYEAGTEPIPPLIASDVEFVATSVIQESDTQGDYSKFTCNFSCPIYHIYEVVDVSVVPQTNPPTMKDSAAMMTIEDATLRGYFQR